MPQSDADMNDRGALVARLFHWLEAKGGLALPAFAFFAGALLSRAFAPVNLFPVLFLCIPLMILLVDQAKSRGQAFGLGWWTGFGLFSVGLNWIGYSFSQQQAVPAYLAPLAILALTAVLALYIGLVFWISWHLKTRGLLRILVFACTWTLFEICRGLLFTGFPWHLLGSAWGDWLWVSQSVFYIGSYGLSLVTLLAAGALVPLVDGSPGRSRFVAPVLGILAIVSLAGLGALRLSSHDTGYHVAISMRLVQANVKQREKWLSHLIDDHFDKHMRLSRSAGSDGKAQGIRLLIWPETAVQRESFDREGSLDRWRISKLLDFGSFAIVGAPRYRATPDRVDYYNSLFAINSKADLYARYDKAHLVPFGEYLPFEDFLSKIGIAQLTGGSSWSVGDGPKTIQLPGIPTFSPFICYEAVFPGAVTAKGARPEWLLNITNDAWFGMTEGPYQHLAQARMRAVEEGLPLVRAASTGVSAVIDPYGRTVASLGLGREGVVESPLPKAIAAAPVSSGARLVLAALFCAFVVLARLAYCWRQGRQMIADSKKL